MDVPFRLSDPDLEADFLAGAAKHDLIELKDTVRWVACGPRSTTRCRSKGSSIGGLHGRVRGDEGLKQTMTEKYRVRVLNHISAGGLKRLPWDRFGRYRRRSMIRTPSWFVRPISRHGDF